MKHGIDPIVLMQTLESSQFWSGYGPNGEPALTDLERTLIARKINSDLRKSHEANGDEFFSELWVAIKPVLGAQNWFVKAPDGEYWLFKDGGIYILCNSIYRRASKLAQKRLESKPKQIYPLVREISNEFSGATV